MSDKIATDVAYKALLSVGMPEMEGLELDGDRWDCTVNYRHPLYYSIDEPCVRDLLTMHALRWLAGIKDVKVEATFYSADIAHLDMLVGGDCMFFDDNGKDILGAICNAAKALKAKRNL